MGKGKGVEEIYVLKKYANVKNNQTCAVIQTKLCVLC